MKKHRLSIAFQTDKSPAEYIYLAKLVNQYPFDVVSVYCDLPHHPSYGPLILMAPHIENAIIGPAAISPSRMHPVDIAANTALLSGIAKSGVYVGLARGAWLDDFGFKPLDKPIQAIKEASSIIKMILSGKVDKFQGDTYKISHKHPISYPVPSVEIPLLIGTWGPKLAGVAGEIADEVKVGGSVNPDFCTLIKMSINLGENRAGRPQDSVGVVMGAVTVVDEDRTLARKLAKMAVSTYFPVVAKLDRTLSIEPELIRQVQRQLVTHDVKAAAGLISDDLLGKFAFAGNPKDLINQSEALFNAGVNRIEFGTPHGTSSDKGINLLGNKVLPYLSEKWLQK